MIKPRRQITYTPAQQLHCLRRARQHLVEARNLLSTGAAPRTVDRVRSAIKSIDGSIRNAERWEQNGRRPTG